MMSKNNNEERKCKICGKIIVGKNKAGICSAYYELSNFKTGDVWPDDEEFIDAFVKYDFYHYYKNYVMRKLEKAVSRDRVNTKPDTIEHVLPQTMNDYWKNVLGDNYKSFMLGI